MGRDFGGGQLALEEETPSREAQDRKIILKGRDKRLRALLGDI